MGNHVSPEKVAYERHLLLGDPDWSNRTAADRNTLPRNKREAFEQCSDRGGSVTPPPGGAGGASGAEESVYYSGTPDGGAATVGGGTGVVRPGGTPLTPGESGASRKSSDDVFCPACAHQVKQN